MRCSIMAFKAREEGQSRRWLAAEPSPKQVGVSRWQVGPTGFTRSSRRVVVAVGGHRYQVQGVAGGFALLPQALARAAEEHHAAGASCVSSSDSRFR